MRFAVWMLQEGVHRCDQGLAEGGNTQLAVIYDRRGMTRKNFDVCSALVPAILRCMAEEAVSSGSRHGGHRTRLLRRAAGQDVRGGRQLVRWVALALSDAGSII